VIPPGRYISPCWEARGGRLIDIQDKVAPGHSPETSAAVNAAEPETETNKVRKLSYKEQRELAELPGRIDKLEQRQQELENNMSQPDFYQSERADIDAVVKELAKVQDDLENAFERWAALED